MTLKDRFTFAEARERGQRIRLNNLELDFNLSHNPSNLLNPDNYDVGTFLVNHKNDLLRAESNRIRTCLAPVGGWLVLSLVSVPVDFFTHSHILDNISNDIVGAVSLVAAASLLVTSSLFRPEIEKTGNVLQIRRGLQSEMASQK